jgi:hypothetical protein
MPVLRDFSPLTLTPDEVLRAQRLGRERENEHPELVSAVARAIAEAAALYQPAAVYVELPVRGIQDRYLFLKDGQRLDIGPKAEEVLGPARLVWIGVSTIGPALEAGVQEKSAAGDIMASYLLDTVGVLALGQVGETSRRAVEERARELGWGVGPSLGPGSLPGWPLTGQRQLLSLVPTDEIGVRLNEFYVLIPHKSASWLIGLGPGYPEHQVGSICHYCTRADTCWRRRG